MDRPSSKICVPLKASSCSSHSSGLRSFNLLKEHKALRKDKFNKFKRQNHKNKVHPEEFLVNQFADSLSYPKMFLDKKLPALG